MYQMNFTDSAPIRIIHPHRDEASELSDTFGRRFSYLRLSLTDACNFRCTYCLPEGYCPSEQPQSMSVEDIQFVVETLSKCGTQKIRLTGGEPTLRKDLSDIVAACSSVKNIKELALTSNAYRLKHQLPKLIEAGLTSLNLSADSLDPTVFHEITGHNKLNAVLEAMNMALNSPLQSVKLNAVLMRQHNTDDIHPYLSLVKDKAVSMRLIELMRTGDNEDFFNAQHYPASKIYERLKSEGWQDVSKPLLAGPARELQHTHYKGRIGFIMPYSNNFCADCNRMRISASGKLHLCLFGEADADLMPFIKARDESALITCLQQVVKTKWQGHQLEQGYSGSTRNLAMLGG